MARASMSPLAEFKRFVRRNFNPRVNFELEGAMLRVTNVKVPTAPSPELVKLIGDDWENESRWLARMGEQYGLQSEGWDEDGNFCYLVPSEARMEVSKPKERDVPTINQTRGNFLSALCDCIEQAPEKEQEALKSAMAAFKTARGNSFSLVIGRSPVLRAVWDALEEGIEVGYDFPRAIEADVHESTE